jgi:kumamolisin
MQNQNWRFLNAVTAVAALTVLVALGAWAQDGRTPGASPEIAQVPPKPPSQTPISSGNTLVPESSLYREEDAGLRAHTNIEVVTKDGVHPWRVIPDTSSDSYPGYETPASIGCIYKVGPAYAGCLSPGGNQHPTTGWGTIALVDAYDNPYAASDLATFDAQFGIPAPPSFTVVYANGNGDCTAPAPNAGWSLESSLDIEYAHAMAPKANIVLVEACSSSDKDLDYAVLVAGNIVTSNGGGDVSNSYGGGEYSGEVADDVNFYTYWENTVYFASAGDSGCGAQYPSASPWVVSAGGTTITRNANTGNFTAEACWSGSGGGISGVEQWDDTKNASQTAFRGNGMGAWGAFQYPQFGGYLQGTYRHTPDLASDAGTPVLIAALYYGMSKGQCSSEPCFYNVIGTSVASPTLAGIVNSANNRLGQAPTGGGFYTNQENNLLYDQLFSFTAYGKNFYDVKTGSNGAGCGAAAKWDFCTGVGTPRGLLGK